jgi:phenylacetate-CoA ligase
METFALQQWVESKIKNKAEHDIEDYQLLGLRKVLDYAYRNSPFYRDLFYSNKIKPGQISSLSDLARVPFTEPESLIRNPYRFLCLPLGEVARVFALTTSGTTGPKKKAFYSHRDLGEISDFMAACISATEADGGAVHILLPRRSPLGQADLLARGVEGLGRMPLLTGVTSDSEKQWQTIAEFKPSIVVGSVSRIYRLTQESRPHHSLEKMGVKAIIPTSEYLSESMRTRLEEAWGCKTREHYGLTEMGLAVAQECPAQDGFHVNEADLLVEVIDPESGQTLNHGEEGELVFTTLNREAMPLIRYRTHDLSRLIPGRCRCGASLKRIDKVTRRIESIIRLGEGDEIYPALFDDVLYQIPEVIDYQAILDRKGSQDCLVIRVEMVKGMSAAVEEAISSLAPIKRNLEAGRMAEPEVEIVAQGTLRKVTRQKKLILDRRPQSQGSPSAIR